MSTFNFSPPVLEWAANNIGQSWKDIAETIITATSKREQKLKEAYNGTLTIKQAENVAKKTRVPYGFLFLDQPPQIKKPSIPDLRQITTPEPLSLDFQETLEDTLAKQEWYIDYLKSIGSDNQLPFVGKYSFNNNISHLDVKNDIAKTLSLDEKETEGCKSTESFFSLLVKKIESIGVLVFKNGTVKGNPHKPLSEKEFRGFALIDNVAPAIFINGVDSKSAQIFTLLHELCHIWIGEAGVSGGDDIANNSIEYFCNKVAAEILTPEEKFLSFWDQNKNEPDFIGKLSKKFKVSSLVIARRAVDFNKISWDEYKEIEKNVYSKIKNRKGKGGGDFYMNIPIRNSKKFTNAVINSAASGSLLLRDAGRLLNINADKVMTLRGKVLTGDVKL